MWLSGSAEAAAAAPSACRGLAARDGALRRRLAAASRARCRSRTGRTACKRGSRPPRLGRFSRCRFRARLCFSSCRRGSVCFHLLPYIHRFCLAPYDQQLADVLHRLCPERRADLLEHSFAIGALIRKHADLDELVSHEIDIDLVKHCRRQAVLPDDDHGRERVGFGAQRATFGGSDAGHASILAAASSRSPRRIVVSCSGHQLAQVVPCLPEARRAAHGGLSVIIG